MSEDPTEDIERRYDTKPTLETVLKELAGVEERLTKRFDALEIRFDRTDSLVHQTRSELLALRADFNEFRAEVREHFPAVK